MNRFALATVLMFALGSPAWAVEEIGTVKLVKVYAYGTPPGEDQGPLYRLHDVFQDELVETVRNGALHLIFLDETEFRMGSASRAVLDTYVYDPDLQTGEMVADLSQGVFRFITGTMEKSGFQVVTPTAYIGVRGTDFTVAVAEDGSTAVSVAEGEVEVTPRGGGAADVVAVGMVASVPATGIGVSVSPGTSASNDTGLGDAAGASGSGGGPGGVKEQESSESQKSSEP